jgi:hypothetical protein
MSNIVYLQCVTSLDLPPDRLLESATGKLKAVVIIGYDEDDNEYFASSIADGGTVIWLMEKMKLALLNG